MKLSCLKYFFSAVCIYFLMAFHAPSLSALEDTSESIQESLDLVVGDINTVPADNLTRVSITNPDIADISDAQSSKVSILAKRGGETVLFLWDASGKRSIKVRVVDEDLGMVKAHLQKLLEEAGITGVAMQENADEGKIVATGDLSREDKVRLDKILDRFRDSVLSFVKEEKPEDLVQVDMQIVEITTNYEQSLGILWGSSSSAAASGTGSTSTGSGAAGGQIGINYNESLPHTNGKIGDFFKIGDFNRTSALVASVNALLQEGKARLISKPRLVVVSGKQASFLVGGEIPIQTTTVNSTGTSSTQSTSYSQYGVNLQVTPTIREGKIDVVLNVDIRDVDNSSLSSGGNIAFITRTASTDLLMDNKQTIALAGLIKYTDSDTETEVPILSKIPVMGALFRSRNIPKNNTEMVIIITPMVLSDKKFSNHQLAMPTPLERQGWQEIDSKYEREPLPNWTAGKVVTANATVIPPEMTAYARMVQGKISRAIHYPYRALQNSWTGTVKLKLRILRSGAMASEEIVQSSGYDVFDADALHAAKMAAPYDEFTAGLEQEDLIFTVPIVYNKMAFEGQSSTEKVIASY